MAGRRCVLFVCLAALAHLNGTSLLQAVTKVGRFAYAVESGKIAAYTLNPTTGQLRNIQNLLTSTVAAITVHPKNKFVYVPTGSNSISVFKIATNGTLTAVAGSPFATTWTPGLIAFTPTGTFAYTENFTSSNNIEIFSVNTATGGLTSIGFAMAGTDASDLAVTPKGTFIYAPNSGDNTISGFAINAVSGALIPINGSPFQNVDNCETVWIHSTGKFLYAAAFDGAVSAYSINPTTGALTTVPGSPFSGGGTQGGYMRGTASGRFLYVASAGGSATGVAAFAINQVTGALTGVPGSPFAAGSIPFGVVADPGSNFLYVENLSPDNEPPLLVFSIDSNTGALTQIGAHGLTGAAGQFLAFTSGTTAVKYTPTFAYVTNSGSNSITELSIANGGLGFVAGSPLSDPNGPQVSVATANGKFLYTGNSNGSSSEYKIGSTGSLTKISGSPVTGFGSNPLGLAIDPLYNLLFVVDPAFTEEHTFQINPKTGKLSVGPFSNPVAGPPQAIAIDFNGTVELVLGNGKLQPGSDSGGGFRDPVDTGSAPAAVAIDPTDRFVYVANSGDDTVSAFAIGIGGFSVSPILGSPFAAGTTPSAIAAEPYGKYLYVANRGGDTISAYSIDPFTGALTAISGTFTTQAGPSALNVSNDGKWLYVTDKGAGQLEQFRINSDGTLTAGGGAGLGTAPTSITTVGTYK